tara:strand:+ start:1807 stop:2529 length:723 start_codon:yes stop_codon:yes gene_type:complete
MALAHSPRIITDGLVLCLDAGNAKSYVGIGNTSINIIDNQTSSLVNGVGFTSLNGGSFVFDGTDDYINLNQGSNEILDVVNTTVSIWFKLDSITSSQSQQTLFGRRSNSTFATFKIFLSQDSISGILTEFRIRAKTASDDEIVSIPNVTPTTEWTNITGTYDGSNMNGYINGELKLNHTMPIGGDLVTGGAGRRMFLGARSNENINRYFNGIISTTNIYNRALTAAEVQQNYNALKGRYV